MVAVHLRRGQPGQPRDDRQLRDRQPPGPGFIDLIVRHSLDNANEQAFGIYLHSWARADILGRIKGNEVPVKVITGEYDPTQPAEFMEQAWLQVYPNSELEVLRGTGHYPMYETPVALAVSIEEFLSRG